MRHIFAAILLLASAGAAAAQADRIQLPPLPGFVVGHQREAGGNAIVEHVPEGETVQAWTRMVTVLRFGGMADRVPPQTLFDNMIDGLGQSCPGATTRIGPELTVSGSAAARLRADCPMNPQTGLPETFIAIGVSGRSDLHSVQVAFRRVPTEAELRWAEALLSQVRLAQ